MIISMAVIRGFKEEIGNKIFDFWGHIQIVDAGIHTTYEKIPLTANQPFIDAIQKLTEVESLDVQVEEETLATNGSIRHYHQFASLRGIIKTRDAMEGVICKGVGADFDTTFFSKYLVSGSFELKENQANRPIVLSQTIANRLSVKLGDKFIVYFVNEGKEIPRRFTVTGIYKTGLDEYDKKVVVVPIATIQSILGWQENQIEGYELFVDDISEIDVISEYIYYELLPPNVFCMSIKDRYPNIFDWLELQNMNEKIIIFLLLLVCIINMTTALLILILERTNMIGILKALGYTNFNIQKIFLYFAGYILAIGIILGDIVGIGICLIQKHFKIIKLDEENYYLDTAPVKLLFENILFVNVIVFVVVLLSLLIPSLFVMRISPLKAIRYK